MEVQRCLHRKPFLGGYRHQLTGAEFHHAGVQTQQKRRPDRGVEAFSRDTQVSSRLGLGSGTHRDPPAPTGTSSVQTLELCCREQQCGVDVSTQMSRPFCYVSCGHDRLLSPGAYTTAGEYLERRLRAVSVRAGGCRLATRLPLLAASPVGVAPHGCRPCR